MYSLLVSFPPDLDLLIFFLHIISPQETSDHPSKSTHVLKAISFRVCGWITTISFCKGRENGFLKLAITL